MNSKKSVVSLSDINQRVALDRRAATQFDELLHNNGRRQIEQALEDVAESRVAR